MGEGPVRSQGSRQDPQGLLAPGRLLGVKRVPVERVAAPEPEPRQPREAAERREGLRTQGHAALWGEREGGGRRKPQIAQYEYSQEEAAPPRQMRPLLLPGRRQCRRQMTFCFGTPVPSGDAKDNEARWARQGTTPCTPRGSGS